MMALTDINVHNKINHKMRQLHSVLWNEIVESTPLERYCKGSRVEPQLSYYNSKIANRFVLSPDEMGSRERILRHRYILEQSIHIA